MKTLRGKSKLLLFALVSFLALLLGFDASLALAGSDDSKSTGRVITTASDTSSSSTTTDRRRRTVPTVPVDKEPVSPSK